MCPRGFLIGLLILELDKATEGLKGSEELHAFDEHIKLARNNVHGHAFISDEDIVRDVGFD